MIDAPDEEGDFVAKLTIKGPSSMGSGHESEPPQFTLYEQTKVVKANEAFSFPKSFMWMGLPAKEYRLRLFHPAYYNRIAPYRFLITPEGNTKGSSVNTVKPRSWKKQLDLDENILQVHISPLSAFWADMGAIESHYKPAVEAFLGKEAAWEQLSRLMTVCELVYEYHYRHKDYLDDEYEERIRATCSEDYIKNVIDF